MKNPGKMPLEKPEPLPAVADDPQLPNPRQSDEPAEPEVQKLIRELHLSQAQLEMRYKQLQQLTEELARSVKKYEDLYESAPVGYLTLDVLGLVLETNLTCAQLLQLDRSHLTGKSLGSLVAPADHSRYTRFLHKLANSETKRNCELTLLRPDGSFFVARLEGISLPGNTPEQRQFRVILADITEQKAAERKVIESQDFAQKIAATMPDILTIYDLERRKNIYGNRSIESLLGISPEKIRRMDPKKLLELVHPDDLAGFQENMAATRQLQAGGISEFEYRVKNEGGGWSWLRVRSVVFQQSTGGQVSQILSVQQDVTSRKVAEEELRFKNQIIEGLQSNLPIVVSIIRPDGTFETMTGTGLESLKKAGLPDMQGDNIYQLFPDLRNKIETVFTTGKKASYIYCVGKDQETCFQNYVFLDPSQQAAVSFSIDISEQIAAEKSINTAREFSQNLLDNSVDGILAFDQDLRFTAWNKVMQKQTKLAKADLLGKKISEFLPVFREAQARQAFARALKGEKVALYNQTFGKEGGLFEAYFNPLVNDAGNVTGGLCILHDISLQKKLEEETIQLKLEQQKEILNAILATQEEERRRIAESLHNGVGQLLYAAKLNLERDATNTKEGRKLLQELLDEAIRETRSISFELIPRILEDFGLETALNELVSRISKAGLVLQFHTSGLKRFSPAVEISAYRIVQELVNNIIKHSRATIASLEVVQEQGLLHISVKDNGIGFNPGEVARQRKGIGLAGMQNRVKLLNGKMTIESREKEGSTFSIELATG